MPEKNKKTETADDGFARDLKVYIENRLKLFSIIISEQVSAVIAASIRKIMALMLLMTGLLILWMSLGFYVGGLLGNTSLGFLIASAPLFVFGFILYNFRFSVLEGKIQTDILNKMPFDFYENSDSDQQKSQTGRD